MSRLFGTDGIRGRVNREPFVPDTLARLGRVIGRVLLDRGVRPRVLMGRDTRQSGPMVGGAVLSGLLSAGVDVTVGGVLPTPAIARLVRRGRYGLGVVISASHNPADDNGVKLFTRSARKAEDDFEDEVERRLGEDAGDLPATTGAYRTWPESAEAYVDDILAEFRDVDLSGLTLAVDCANGATSVTGPEALRRLGARVEAIHASPDGLNINRRCGALHPKVVARAVRKLSAAGGITFDGDGDRALFSDERGNLIDGDATLAILARDRLARRRLPKRTVVATVMSNLGLERSLAEVGCRLVRTDVGDRNVVAEMDAGGAALGGEQSGHVIVRRGARMIGDGLETALHLLRALASSGEPLSALAGCFTRAPQVLLGVRVSRKPPLAELPAVADAVAAVTEELGDAGRVNVRYSGTEPLARVMVEGPDRARTRRSAERIAGAIEKEIGSRT